MYRNKEAKKSYLIIGYGNTIRCDDGVGQIIAMEIEQWNLPQVSCLYQQQLTPELAETMARFATVIFIDASVDVDQVSLVAIASSEYNQNWTHHLTPSSLLYLTEYLYQQKPQSWLLKIPITNLNLGENLSNLALENKQKALEIIKIIIT